MSGSKINTTDAIFEITHGNLVIKAGLPLEARPQGWEEMSEEERREALDWGDFKFELLGFNRGHEDFKKKVFDQAAGTDF